MRNVKLTLVIVGLACGELACGEEEPAPVCQGYADSCFTFHDWVDCENQDGCYWTPSSGCSGIVDECDTFASDYYCELQDGCHWE